MGCANSSAQWTTATDHQVPPATSGVFNMADSSTKASQDARAQPGLPHTPQAPDLEDEIAIVGIGCRTPGADNIREFWRVLVNGECHVTDVPPERWNASAYLSKDPRAVGKAYVQKGGFIKDIEGFDNGLYGISDYEASQMDPQQCLMLDCTLMALEDAGFTRSQISGSNMGVFVGAMNSDHRSGAVGLVSNIGSYTATGNSTSFLSARLSYVFNLLGPSMVIDSACSASLVALHQGCQAIRTGDCDTAICGGVNAMSLPDVFVHLSKARMISPTGLCHTFSDKADGYARSEGCGVLILKRLQDAIRDGDHVWATVCTGTNQDGRTVTPMTAPSGAQQGKLLRSVYDKFGIDVQDIDYMEAHGTGTVAGDPVEVNALGTFLKERSQPRERYIGSVKTNIGHTESASSILCVIKLALMMKHGMIVPSLHCDVVHPKISLADLRFAIPKEAIPWSRSQKLTCCNSFGFGGSNCHAVLRSYCRSEMPEERSVGPCIVCFSGKTMKSLKGSMEDLCADEEAPLLNVHDVSYTSTARRDHYSHRAAFLVNDMQDLMAAVSDRLAADQWPSPVPNQLHVIFVFCGMGTTWPGMCRQLMVENRVFLDTLMDIENHLSSYVSWSLTERLKQEDPSKDILLAPVSIFACQVGLAAVWQSLGVQPSCVVGQSIGEVAAGYVAGCISLADAVKIVYHRSELLAQVTGGSMVIIQNVEVDRVRQVLKESAIAATVSLEYSAKACAISTSEETLPSLKRHLLSKLKSEHRSMQMVDLDVSVAFHSPFVDPCVEKLAKALSKLSASAPKIPFVSSVTGAHFTSLSNADYWVENMRKPVLFRQAITRSYHDLAASKTVFVEIGPKPILRAHLKDLFPTENVLAIPSMTRQSEEGGFLRAVIALYEQGADITWTALPTSITAITDVPRYAFDKKHQANRSESQIIFRSGIDFFHKEHLYTCPVRDDMKSFLLMISPLVVPSIYDHVAFGKIVVPGAYFAEAGFAIAQFCQVNRPAITVEFEHAVPVKKDEVTDFAVRFEASAQKSELKLPQMFVHKENRRVATIQIRDNGLSSQEQVNLQHIQSKSKQVVDKSEIYSTLSKSGFQYGEAYALLQHCYRSSTECLAMLKVNEIVQGEMTSTTFHPSILDCVLQSTSMAMPENNGPSQEVLPKGIGKLVVHRPMQFVMYVHTRLKQKDSKRFTFDQQVLSPTGHVIADVTDFVIQVIRRQTEESVPEPITTEWQRLADNVQLDTTGDAGVIQKPEVIFLTDADFMKDNGNYLSMDFSGQMDMGAIADKVKKLLSSHQQATALVLLYSGKPLDKTDGEAVHDMVVNSCCLIQTILKSLSEMSSNIPFYLCTFNAWPSTVDDVTARVISPAATALWGLLRTVTVERVYSHVAAVELHLPPNFLNGQSLSALFCYLATGTSVGDYPELLVTSEGIFANQVVKDKNSLLYQTISSSRMSDNSQLLDEPCKSARCKDSDPHTSLRLQDFGQGNDELFKIRGVTSSLQSSSTARALEVRGQALNQPGNEMVSCCPVRVEREVTVPDDCVVSISVIPDYQMGDITKLVVLWSLNDKTRSQNVTILSSTATRPLAQLLQLMSSKSNDTETSIVIFEDLDSVASFSGDLVTLVFLDSNVMTAIGEKWLNPGCLVTCSVLVSAEALSVLAYTLPDADAVLVDTQLLFFPCRLRKTIPQIKAWMKANQSQMARVSQSLHSCSFQENTADLTRLLKFTTVSLNAHGESDNDGAAIRKNALYLVVGGLTGLGWICVEFLAHSNAGYIAIINRRAPNEEQTESIKNLSHSFSCKIQAFQADVTSLDALKKVYKQITECSNGFQLRGIFFGAAVLQDGVFSTMSRSAFDRVLAPKVRGAWNVHQLTMHLPLDFFVIHSSIVSVVGNMGQANYVAGNAFLDGLVYHRRQQGLAAQTVNWGPLDTGLLDGQEAIKSKMESVGFHIASKQEILATLRAVLRLQQMQSVPALIDPKLYAKRLYSTPWKPLTLRFHKFAHAPKVQQEVGAHGFPDASKIRFLPSEERVRAYESYVREQISHVLTVELTQITPDVPLLDLGVDSLSSTLLLDQIQRDTTFQLAAVEIFAGESTVVTLARALDDCANALSQ